MKYTAKIHIHPNSESVRFIGEVSANTIPALKEKARAHAASWNHQGTKLHIEDVNTGREWMIRN